MALDDVTLLLSWSFALESLMPSRTSARKWILPVNFDTGLNWDEDYIKNCHLAGAPFSFLSLFDRCEELKITNLCFADDLLILSNGDVNLVSVIREALEEFSEVSRLYPNLSKSVMFCSNVNEETKEAILQVVPFTIGKLPARYLGVPLPKCNGGLGLKPLDIWNKELMTRHIWNVASKKDSLWVKWINVYRIKRKNIWEVDYDCNASWGWRKLMELRVMNRPHYWSNIGNGMNTNFWQDK
ncbi:hypothetical protein Tco_0861565 [Tanacetum coccineum]|uniref:Reverse transcriptase domain-containing protein n=1 Tax=Tanacetum coccineum TaxID=301880 RepID=A0ABQ5BLS0_9ASTR